MKKLLIATILLAGLTTFAPHASACDKDRVFVGYDRCGHPVWREVRRPSYGSYEERPQYYREAPPVRYRSYDDDDRDYRPRCQEQRRRVSPLAFIFGF